MLLVYVGISNKKTLKKTKHIGMECQKATKQGRNDTTILLWIVIPISFAIFPTRSHYSYT